MSDTAEILAQWFHDEYERLAPEFGYKTREDTRTFDPESANGKLMIAVCSGFADEIERLTDQLERINRWCRAYPRTVFIEPTKEQWAEANKLLEAHRPACPSLTAMSGSIMRHVVEGIQALAALNRGEPEICQHGNGLTDYCEPCGRINGGG
jgi:hypothetical protein